MRWKNVREASREFATGASQSLEEAAAAEEEAEAEEEEEEDAAAEAASARSPIAEASFANSSVLPLLDTADKSALADSKWCIASAAAWT